MTSSTLRALQLVPSLGCRLHFTSNLPVLQLSRGFFFATLSIYLGPALIYSAAQGLIAVFRLDHISTREQLSFNGLLNVTGLERPLTVL